MRLFSLPDFLPGYFRSCMLIPFLMLFVSSTGQGIDTDVPAVKDYPLTTCPIEGTQLGTKGDTITRVFKGQEVQFCCKSCMTTFEQNVDGNLGKVKAAIAKAGVKPVAKTHEKQK